MALIERTIMSLSRAGITEVTFQDIVNLLPFNDKSKDNNNVQDFSSIVEDSQVLPFEGSDPKVMDFLRILEEYRTKCEEEGNYKEAAKANKQLEVLKEQETKRQEKAVRARQLSDLQDIQRSHVIQFEEFNRSWDKYMEDFDNMSKSYIQQMTERHAILLLEFQKQLSEELAKRPLKFSKELVEMRRVEAMHVKNRNYVEAQKVKAICDKIEDKERGDNNQDFALVFARREASFRQQQENELQALFKRIEGRRKEHLKQRSIDTKRLLQRNKNVQSVLESKQSLENQRLHDEIRKNLTTHLFPQLQHKNNTSLVKNSRNKLKPIVESEKRSDNNKMQVSFFTTEFIENNNKNMNI